MFKNRICMLLAVVMLLALVPVGAYAEENQLTGQPPVVWGITCEDREPFVLTGPVRVVRSSEYPNNPPSWVDTVDEKVEWIADQCRAAGKTDPWEIALWLHDWLIYNANYDYTYTRYDADGVLLLGSGVCNSYALAYGLLLDEFGIENIKLDSYAMSHAWNLVKLNGQWCHVDCTWDDPGDGGSETFIYFGMDDELMSRDHYWDTSAYPACPSRENYYLIRMEVPVATTKAEMMVSLSRQAANKEEVLECFYMGTDPNFSVIDTFREWMDTYYWKYGIYGWSCRYTQMMISATVTYGTPWGEPSDFDTTHTHIFAEEETAPTCGEQGYTTYICPCDYSYRDNFVAATGKHTYSNSGDTTCNICGAERETEVDSVPMHRMYDPNSGEHFYTGSTDERDFLVKAGWHYEGVGFNFPREGRPVYRLYEPTHGEHLYTMNEAEKEKLLSWGWNDEGVAFNSAGTDEVPQYRLHNPNAKRGGYHFTGSIEERNFLISIGWIDEGIGWYSCKE